MKTICLSVMISILLFAGCNQEESKQTTAKTDSKEKVTTGQSEVKDDVSQKDIVKVAVGSNDHTTLAAAIQAADLTNSLANAGPFTVFAPVNAAFEKLPAGTVDDLLKPENKSKLASILQHHVAVAVYNADMLTDGRILGMVDGKNVTVTKQGSDILIDGAKIIATVPASNGVIHVVDAVILPK